MTCERIAMQQNMYCVATVQNQQLTIRKILWKWGKKSASRKFARGGAKNGRVVLDGVG